MLSFKIILNKLFQFYCLNILRFATSIFLIRHSYLLTPLQPSQVKLRAPVSESLSRLQRDQLQKFAQYLISELPQQILPTAQRLIDEILSSQTSDINTVSGRKILLVVLCVFENFLKLFLFALLHLFLAL